MGLKNLDIKRSYISYGDDNIPKAFLVPALRYAKSYQRSVGFFSSSVFLPIMDGIVSLFRNGGKIQLSASPQLSEEDIQAINLGYEKRDKVITDAATRDFMSSFQEFDEVKLQLLVDLIASGTLDIKIATLTSVGIYHDKLGIIKDFEGNAIVFFGSANSSINAYQNNYEKIRVVKSWDETENDVIEEEENEFESLWQGKNPYVNVLSYSESAKENLITIIHNKKTEAEDAKDPIKLRDYQEEAIAAWVANDYHGFYVMATGTGKTWTAIFSAKKLLEQHPAMVVICAPYKHLVRQWADDVIKAFPDAKIVMVSSENAKWESQLSDLIIRKKYQKDLQIIVISTIASFKMQRFNKTLGYSREQKLLIVDEAHRFTERPDALHKQFQYMLGLSATPFSGSSAQKGQELMKFFGGQVFSLPIESALERGFLVPYYYYPIYVNAQQFRFPVGGHFRGLNFFGHYGNKGFTLVGWQQHFRFPVTFAFQKTFRHQLFDSSGTGRWGSDALTLHTLRHTVRTGGLHRVQQGVLGKMLRWGRLTLLQLCIEDAALVFCRIGQGGEFLFPVQDVCQHLALHCFPAFLQNLLAFGGKFLPGTFGGQQGFQITEGLADCHQRPGDDELQDVLLPLGQ